MSFVSMISAPAPTLPNVQLPYGPILIGVFFNMILYGVLLMQTLTYYQVYQRDPKWMRLLIAFLLFVETANTSLDMAMMYQPLILEYSTDLAVCSFPAVQFHQVKNPYFSRLVGLHHQVHSATEGFVFQEPLCVVLVSMPIQLLYAWRIHRLTNSLWIPAIISVLAIASFGTGILFVLYGDTNKLRMTTAGGVWTATTIQILRQFAKKPLLHNSALLWFLAACAADILITVSLVMTLSSDQLLYSQHYAVPLIDKFNSRPRNLVWDLSLSKLYCNCLMSTLNARERLRQQQQSVVLSLATQDCSFRFTTAGPLGSETCSGVGGEREVPDSE
ncbi:hypothetical protein C8R45DRAFT_942907 [Mycena sanguinolenta]|nr:hypothetical protein C8R45DRAFT_942907 [Mycena sanguinolenta]